jgi:hypothetical protein
MATIRNPATFSTRFEVPPSALKRLGALDPVLNADTNLFIDPMLLAESRHREMKRAAQRFHHHFATLASLLAASATRGDVAWRGAEAAFTTSEIKANCLGYGAATISGSGVGRTLAGRLLATAKEIIDLGVADPDLFPALALLEADVGPDRISDMTTNVIFPDLAAFTQRLCQRLKVTTGRFTMSGSTFRLPRNPFDRSVPILLVPRDVLRPLPIAADWDGVRAAARHNALLRQRVNQYIAAIWESHSKKQKETLRDEALASRAGIQTLLDAIHNVDPEPYAADDDPKGVLTWHERLSIARRYPMSLALPPARTRTRQDVMLVVMAIVHRFKVLIEDKGLWKDLWSGYSRRPEKAAQRLFLAVADSYCKANHLDLSPETDSGGGPVDFKLSQGSEATALVELKLSSNHKLVDGYTKQLEVYKSAEECGRAVFLVIDVGAMGKRGQELRSMRERRVRAGLPASELVFVDGSRKRSASKR